MYGLGYSLKQNFKFSRKEFTELFWTAVVFAFIEAARQPGVGFKIEIAIVRFIFFLVIVFASLYVHVSLQKIAAIKLGYKATYSYWLNGLLIVLVLAIMFLPLADIFPLYSIYGLGLIFILPGAVMIEHIPQLRLGKFRYGTNLKDIGRVAMAGSIAHILMVMFLGIFYFIAGRNVMLLTFMLVNLLLAIYSMLPVPKIDWPSKMDSGSDGLALFLFSRTLYVLVFFTILIYTALVFFAVSVAQLWWFFILAFILGSIVSALYSIAIEQRN